MFTALRSLQDLSSLTRDWTWAGAVKALGRWQWTTREFPKTTFLTHFWGRKLVSPLPLPLALSRGSQLGVGSTRGPSGPFPGGTQQCPRTRQEVTLCPGPFCSTETPHLAPDLTSTLALRPPGGARRGRGFPSDQRLLVAPFSPPAHRLWLAFSSKVRP